MADKLVIETRYGVTPNDILNDKELSFKAKGIYGFIQSKPPGWKFSVQKMVKQSKDGKDGISAGVKELEKVGLLERRKFKDKGGQWNCEYYLKANRDGSAVTVKPPTEKPSPDNPQILVNKNSKQDIVNNKEIATASQGVQVNDYIEILKPLNEIAYTKWFANKTQRANVELIAKKFSEAQLRHLVEFIVMNKDQSLFPSVKSPSELVDKMPSVQKFWDTGGYQKKRETVVA